MGLFIPPQALLGTPNIWRAAQTFAAAVLFASGTITTSQPLTVTQTWNAGATVFQGHVVNISDTASSLLSGFYEAQVGGASYFRVGRGSAGTAAIWLPYGSLTPSTSNYALAQSSVGLDINAPTSTRVNIGVNANWGFVVKTGGVVISNPGDYLGWGGSAVADAFLYRDGAANTLAQRNGTAAQQFNFYKTYTDASNYERMEFFVSGGGAFCIQSNQAGTGSARALGLGTKGSAALTLYTTDTNRWQVDSAGMFIAALDNTYDIGASGATRPRNVYVAGALTLGGNISCNQIQAGIVYANSGFGMGTAGASGVLQAAADGVWTLYNGAQTSWGRLNFGGTTSSFPALKRSSAVLQARLADDSNFCALQGLLRTAANAVAETIAPDHTLVITDASGQAYRVPCQV